MFHRNDEVFPLVKPRIYVSIYGDLCDESALQRAGYEKDARPVLWEAGLVRGMSTQPNNGFCWNSSGNEDHCKQRLTPNYKQEVLMEKCQRDGITVPENHEISYPVISIIIPVYNVAQYIREALDSAVNQSYKKLEIIVIDDGSTDGSGQICDGYKTDPRVTVIHQKHQGVSNARNVGLNFATGDFIAFLDSDDAYHPDFIQCMLTAIDNVDVSVCRFARYKRTLDIGSADGRSKGKPAPIAKAGCYDRVIALHAHLYGLISTAIWDKLYRKALWKDVRFPDGHIWEDIDVVYRILDRCNRVNVIDRVLYFYRMRPGSITHTSTKGSCEDHIRSFDHLSMFVEENVPNCFDETHLRFIRQRQMNKRIRAFIQGHMDAKTVKAYYEGMNPEDFSLSSRIAYRMIFLCPWLLKVLYPVYHNLLKWHGELFGSRKDG